MRFRDLNTLRSLLVGSLLAGWLAVPSTASAGIITIDTIKTTPGNISSNSVSFFDAASGITLDIVAFVRSDGDDAAAQVRSRSIVGRTRAEAGLGVDARPPVGNDENAGQINNFAEDAEWLAIRASQASIIGVELSLFEDAERVRIIGSDTANFLDGTRPADEELVVPFPVGVTAVNPQPLAFANPGFEYVSVFVGEGGNFNGNGRSLQDGVRLISVTVVPAPATLALFGLGLAAFGFRRGKSV